MNAKKGMKDDPARYADLYDEYNRLQRESERAWERWYEAHLANRTVQKERYLKIMARIEEIGRDLDRMNPLTSNQTTHLPGESP